MMQRRKNRVAREEELSSAVLNPLQVDIRPALEQTAHILDRHASLHLHVLVEEPLALARKRYDHVLNDALAGIVGFARQEDGALGLRLEVEVALCRIAELREAAEEERFVMRGAVR